MEVISKLRSQPAVADPNEHHSLDGSDVPEEYLHPCCQKELKASRKKNEVMGKLREGDRVRKALEMRRTALGLAGMPENDHDHCHGSGCCELMVDYPALQEARAAFRQSHGETASEQAPVPDKSAESEGSEDEDDKDDELLNELDGEAKQIMEIRMAEMMRKALEFEELRRLGIGLHVEAKAADVFHLIDLRSTVVCHLYDAYSEDCARVDLALEELASKYPGTRFCRMELRRAASLVERLRLPDVRSGNAVLMSIVDGCVRDTCADYRRFGAPGGLHADVLEEWLHRCHALIREMPSLPRARESVRQKGKAGTGSGKGDEEEEEEFYDCGLDGCRKSFAHDHIGLTALPSAIQGL